MATLKTFAKTVFWIGLVFWGLTAFVAATRSDVTTGHPTSQR